MIDYVMHVLKRSMLNAFLRIKVPSMVKLGLKDGGTSVTSDFVW